MADDNESSLQELLGFPTPAAIGAQDVHEEYAKFLQQLEIAPGGSVVLSNPYFFEVETDGITTSVETWLRNIAAATRIRLLLLSVLCRPFDHSRVWPEDRPRFIDDSLTRLLFGVPTISLAEGTSGIPFGIDGLAERRRVLDDPEMKLLMDAVSPKSEIETMTSEFIGEQPGNYAYQGWQVATWSREWAVVYGICDTAHGEGYPFPWLLGFCRINDLERNFIVLLREGARRFDSGFYSTYGTVWGQWRLASIVLSLCDDDEEPRWDIIDQLLSLDDTLLNSILDEGPENPKEFLSRIDAIVQGAAEAGFDEDVSLVELLDKVGSQRSLAAIEELLPEWQEAHQAEREEKLLPFNDVLESWVAVAVGPPPRSPTAGMCWMMRRGDIRSYLEAYLLKHGELPTGSHDLGCTRGFQGGVRMVDFDDIAKRAERMSRDN